jgi:Ser/Thr protein kinase RdoA (MazF antagonist)
MGLRRMGGIALTDMGLQHDGVLGVLAQFGCEGSRLSLLNVSENDTWRVTLPDGSPAVLRQYRAGRTAAEVAAELAWMRALAGEADISVPPVRAAADGAPFVTVGERHYAMFGWVRGAEPDEAELVRWFGRLGDVCARLHRHADGWASTALARPLYGFDALVGEQALWGPWRHAPGLESSEVELIERVVDALRQRLAALPDAATGLIHGDLRLANLLVDDNRLTVIDFDDCGFGWRLYDLATALSLTEDAAEAPAAAYAWLEAYHRRRPIAAAERALVPDMIMLRRIQVLAWFASHADTDIARDLGPASIAATIAAADRFEQGKSPFKH